MERGKECIRSFLSPISSVQPHSRRTTCPRHAVCGCIRTFDGPQPFRFRGRGQSDMTNRVQWLGHSCLLFEIGNKRVLIDPFLTGNPMAAAKAEDLTVDLILISHGRSRRSCGRCRLDRPRRTKREGGEQIYEISVWLQGNPGLAGRPDDRDAARRRHDDRHDGIGRIKLTLAFHGSVSARRWAKNGEATLRVFAHRVRRHQRSTTPPIPPCLATCA